MCNEKYREIFMEINFFFFFFFFFSFLMKESINLDMSDGINSFFFFQNFFVSFQINSAD